MQRVPASRSKRWLHGAAAGLAAFAGGEKLARASWVDLSDNAIQRAAALDRFHRGHEGVLGTSLDVIIEAASPDAAAACETHLLAEIERLRRVCSTYDPASEISRVAAGASVTSPELAELFAAYATWTERTGGLIDANLGGVVTLWREAARTGRVPDRAALQRATRQPRAYNVDALGKAFIVDRAVAVARRFAPAGLLNLGGDIRAWGDTTWAIGVADPRDPAENAPPLARFALRAAAVATSGGYARFFAVGENRFSHLIDPRTLQPLEAGGSATVVASDCVTANALATAASIGGPDTGARLARRHGATGYFFATPAGAITGGGVLLPTAAAPAIPPQADLSGASASGPTTPVAASALWPEGFRLAVQVTLKKADVPRYRRPYVVVWVENERREVVRTITVWGDRGRYLRDLSEWWHKMRGDDAEPQTMTRATRAPGTYLVTWNGTDEGGRRVPPGTYTLCLEITREYGHHVIEEIKVACGQESANFSLPETAESDASAVNYGPAPK